MPPNETTYVADDRELSEHLEDLEPDADVLRALRHGAPRLAHKLLHTCKHSVMGVQEAG